MLHLVSMLFGTSIPTSFSSLLKMFFSLFFTMYSNTCINLRRVSLLPPLHNYKQIATACLVRVILARPVACVEICTKLTSRVRHVSKHISSASSRARVCLDGQRSHLAPREFRLRSIQCSLRFLISLGCTYAASTMSHP